MSLALVAACPAWQLLRRRRSSWSYRQLADLPDPLLELVLAVEVVVAEERTVALGHLARRRRVGRAGEERGRARDRERAFHASLRHGARRRRAIPGLGICHVRLFRPWNRT
jgi:hypothetical protein